MSIGVTDSDSNFVLAARKIGQLLRVRCGSGRKSSIENNVVAVVGRDVAVVAASSINSTNKPLVCGGGMGSCCCHGNDIISLFGDARDIHG